MDLLRSIEAFVRVTESRSFAKASRQIGVARSVVTTRVKQLEQHLGASLLHRSTRAIKPTEMGDAYYQECSELLVRLNELVLRSQRDSVALKGTIRMHVLPGFALGHFSKALLDFRAAYPQIDFEISVNDRVVDPVQEGLDLVLQLFPPASNSLVERRLFPVRGIFCATSAVLRRAPLLHPKDLEQHDFASYSSYPWGNNWPLMRGNESIPTILKPMLRTNSVHLLLEFARSGAGVAYLPTMVAAPDLLERRIERVLPEFSAPPLWFSAVYPTSHRTTAKVKAFVDFLRARFPVEPQWDVALGFPPLSRVDRDRA